MRIETIPLILGILVALLGIGIIFDAWTPEAMSVSRERRRRPRIDRHRNGEALIGLGVLALGAAFIGRDSWRYSVLVVIIGALFLVVGAALNARYVRELFVNRGPLRRRDPNEVVTAAAPGGDQPVPLERTQAADTNQGEIQPTRAADWDGMERRQTPREGGKRKPARRGTGEDSPRG